MRSNVGALILGTALLCLFGASLATAHSKGPIHRGRHARPQQVSIAVTEAGFVPASVTVRRGVPIVLLVTRTTDQTCATQAVFPTIHKTVELPLNKAVRVALAAQPAGRVNFACGMGMYHGALVVE